jgi:hypothetical protein
MEDWYSITRKAILNAGESSFISKRGNWMRKSLNIIYPYHYWMPWRLGKVPPNFWQDIQHQRGFFDWLGQQLRFSSLNDWYNVNVESLVEYGGSGIVSCYYGGSLANTLSSIYPQHSWYPWKFQRVEYRFWENKDNQKRFIHWLSKELQIFHLEDWYRVSLKDIQRVAPTTLFIYQKGLATVLSDLYPQHPWELAKLSSQYVHQK